MIELVETKTIERAHVYACVLEDALRKAGKVGINYGNKTLFIRRVYSANNIPLEYLACMDGFNNSADLTSGACDGAYLFQGYRINNANLSQVEWLIDNHHSILEVINARL